MSKILKTSEEWLRDSTYAGLEIVDPLGWPQEPIEFKFHWFEERINKEEFDSRVFESKVKWSLSKI